MPEFLTIKEIKEMLKISTWKANEIIHNKKVKKVKVGRIYRIYKTEFLDLLASGKTF